MVFCCGGKALKETAVLDGVVVKMEYLYCANDNFEDFASGRVLYGGKGIPNFPVRLLLEIYGRARSWLDIEDSHHQERNITIYDPCCGGGYALTVLGFFHNKEIMKIYGSDIDENMIVHAKENALLLTDAGINKRKEEIRHLYDEYGKNSHLEALHSCDKLRDMLVQDMAVEIFKADCTGELPRILPDLIITDIPYGNLVEWDNGEAVSLDDMLERLWAVSHEKTILAVCMDKKQRINCDKWKRLEKQNVGKRKFEIMKKVAF